MRSKQSLIANINKLVSHLDFFFVLGFRFINLSEVGLGMQNVSGEFTAQTFGFRHHFGYH